MGRRFLEGELRREQKEFEDHTLRDLENGDFFRFHFRQLQARSL
jgi:hypothetical protein